MSSVSQLKQTLKRAGYSTTQARRVVFMALEDQQPMTIAQLANKTASAIDRASIYRVVRLFEKLGIITRLQLGWKYKIELSDEFQEHHHHLSCVKCGHVSTFQEPSQLISSLNQLATDNGYSLVSHQLELNGICKQCRKKSRTPAV